MVRITALMDNQASEHRLLRNEHGLSYLLETEHGRFLFDCGGSANTLYNAHRLGLSLKNLTGVILSHAHYDHAAGYRDLIEAGLGSKTLYIGPHFFEPKYAFDGVRYTDLSAAFDASFLNEYGITAKVTEGKVKLADGLWLVSGFSRKHAFETIPSRFVRLTPEGFVVDDFCDEQCLVLERESGLVILVGCSHPGILNMVDTVHEWFDKPVVAVYGGTHLVEANEERVENTLVKLHGLGLCTCGFSHCSGANAENLAKAHPELATCHLSCGDSIFLE